MYVFIHCVLEIIITQIIILKVGQEKLAVVPYACDLICSAADAAVDWSSLGAVLEIPVIWECRDSLTTSHTRCQNKSCSLFVRVALSWLLMAC